MKSTASRPDKDTDSTAIQPATVFLGVDAKGRHHVWRRDADRISVIAIEAGTRSLVFDLDGAPLEKWMDFIADRTGWLTPQYGIRSVDYDEFRPRGF